MKQKLMNIDCVMYFVRNLEKSAQFYEKMLGLKRVWTDRKQKMIGLKFPKGGSEIVIHTNPKIPNPDFSFLVKDVAVFCAEFKKKGFKIVKKPFDVRCGKFAVLADPDGNQIPIVDLTKFGNKPRYD